MDVKLPFAEHREVIAERHVRVPLDMITNLRPNSDITPSTPLMDNDGTQGVIRIYDRIYLTPNASGTRAPFGFIRVDVEAVQDTADVVIMGQVKWKLRNKNSNLPTVDAWAGECTTWTRGNGRLATLLRCHTFEILVQVTVFGPPTPRAAPSTAPLRSLAELSDVTLRAAGGDFAVHRVVLAASSPVLRAMFMGDFKESTEKVVELDVDCSADVFDAFVDFLYSGALGERNCADLVDLLELAERYMVDQLKEDCVRRLLAVGPDGAFTVFQAALEKAFVPSEVRLKAAEVVRQNWQTVVASHDWRTFVANQPTAALVMESFLSPLGSEAAPTQ